MGIEVLQQKERGQQQQQQQPQKKKKKRRKKRKKALPAEEKRQEQQEQQQKQERMVGELTLAMLAASPEMRKNMIGEKLFPLVESRRPGRGGKVTGMLLEAMHTAELIELLESPTALGEKVDEAVAVLQAHGRLGESELT